ncbi:MAG: beta-ketoacyl synthase N-terminal-like domain-containing protein, partial [Planctomycetota bacterium]
MKSTTKRRVAVTGLGAVTNVGVDAPTTWKSLVAGRSGISTITAFEQDDEWPVRIAGEVRDWDPARAIDARDLKRIDRFCALGMYAADEAARDCGLDFQ